MVVGPLLASSLPSVVLRGATRCRVRARRAPTGRRTARSTSTRESRTITGSVRICARSTTRGAPVCASRRSVWHSPTCHATRRSRLFLATVSFPRSIHGGRRAFHVIARPLGTSMTCVTTTSSESSASTCAALRRREVCASLPRMSVAWPAARSGGHGDVRVREALRVRVRRRARVVLARSMGLAPGGAWSSARLPKGCVLLPPPRACAGRAPLDR